MRHLAPLLDWQQAAAAAAAAAATGEGQCTPPSNPSDFASMPTGSFLGAGEAFPSACTGSAYVAWDRAAPTAATSFSQAAPLHLPLMPLRPAQWNIAPMLNGLAFLGEQGKVTAVSSHRFSSITVQGSTARVALRGAPGEAVTLLWALAPALAIESRTVTLGEDGTAVATLP